MAFKLTKKQLDERDVHVEALNAAQAWLETLHNEHDEAFSEKSEAWQDGDKGSSTREWIDKFEEVRSQIEDANGELESLTQEPE